MLNLPQTIKYTFSLLEIPSDLRKKSNHPIVNIVTLATENYRELINDLEKPNLWENLKQYISQRTLDLKIEKYIDFYEKPNNIFYLLNQVIVTLNFKEDIVQLLESHGFGDIASERIETVDSERLKSLAELTLNGIINFFKEWDRMNDKEALAQASILINSRTENDQLKINKIIQLISSHILISFYNALSIMTNRRSMYTLVRKALLDNEASDEAMCLAIRIDNNLRNHPVFMERYRRATNESDQKFLDKYNDVSSPITHKTKYMGVYFLISMLNAFGLLDKFTNRQILDLCDLSGLYKYENRIEEAKYISRIRNEFLELNSIEMSTN